MVNADGKRRREPGFVVARREQALKVEIPTSDADRLKLGRVGLVAFGGFVLGMAWPRLAGVTLVPSPPLDEQAQPAPEPAADESAAPAAATPPASAAAATGAPAPAPAADVLVVEVGKATITSCRDERGRRTEQCGSVDFDSVVRPPLEALSGCRAAGGVRGTLSLGFEVDFEAKKIKDLKSGKSTTLGSQTAGALTACAKEHLDAVKLDGVAHDHTAYTVYYSVEISPNEGQTAAAAEPTPAAASAADIVAASGRATVSWQVALIRSEPKEGEVVARVLNGTRVVVTGRKGEWYRVKYDAKGNEGWVYRTAIGL